MVESCSHVASVLFYLEAWNRIYGKLACTQVKCLWSLPKSCAVPVVSDLFQIENLDHDYPTLLRKCASLKLHISANEINLVEMDTWSQAKGSGFFGHCASRVRASVGGSTFNSNLAQSPQSLIKTMRFPQLFGVNTKAIQHGYKYEDKEMPSKKRKTADRWLSGLSIGLSRGRP